MQTITITRTDEGRRLDRYLMRYFDQAPQSFVYKNLRKKNIKLSGRKATGEEILKPGDEIELFFKDETLMDLSTRAARLLAAGHEGQCPDQGPEADSLKHNPAGEGKGLSLRGDTVRSGGLNDYCRIVYEDDNIIFADKKMGVLSQKSRREDYSLNEALLDYVTENAGTCGNFTPSICNRLDRNTSGLIIFAKTYAAAREVSRILKDRSLKKYYLALCEGVITESMDLSSWLTKNERTNTVRVSDRESEGASLIETYYEPLGVLSLCGRKLSLLKVGLITGKTHQIRAHLASIGHPLAGDRRYGDAEFASRLKKQTGCSGLFLHSWYVELPHTLHSPIANLGGITFKAAPPSAFSKIINENGIMI